MRMFGGSGRRRGAVRTDVSPAERAISLVVLVLIAGIGVALYLKGQHFDPSLFSLDPSLLPSAVQPTARLEQSGLVTEGDVAPPGRAGTASPAGALLAGVVPDGWEVLGGLEEFSAEDLYEKINGRAEQFLAYDVVGLNCVSLVHREDTKRFIDIFLYDMGAPLRAFGIYSVERSPGQPSIDLGREGYGVEASYFFWKGRYYGQVIASETGDAAEGVSLAIARDLEARLEDAGEPVWGLDALPEDKRVPGSVQYFMVDALSLDFLGNAYVARYRQGGAELTVFLSRQPSAAEAEQVFAGYDGYLEAYGEVVDRRRTGGATWVTGDMGGVFDVVFQKDRLLGGITMAEDRAAAERAAAEILARVEE